MLPHDEHPGAGAGPYPPWWRTRSGIVLCGFLLVAGFYLVAEHTAHVFGALPYLLLAACPLMHLFMHHGHGGHGGGGGSDAGKGGGGTP
jgi:hypothetical protein